MGLYVNSIAVVQAPAFKIASYFFCTKYSRSAEIQIIIIIIIINAEFSIGSYEIDEFIS